jgi:hypothetical protein
MGMGSALKGRHKHLDYNEMPVPPFQSLFLSFHDTRGSRARFACSYTPGFAIPRFQRLNGIFETTSGEPLQMSCEVCDYATICGCNEKH